MVTAATAVPAPPPEESEKNGVALPNPVELVEIATVTAPDAAVGLPNTSWSCSWNGPPCAVDDTDWGFVGAFEKASCVAGAGVMANGSLVAESREPSVAVRV